MVEKHKKIDLSHLTDSKKKEIDSAAELVYIDTEEKEQLREIKKTMESERRELTEGECKKLLGKARNLHEAAEWFVNEKDSPIAPGAVLGVYHQLAEEISLVREAEIDEKLQKMTYYHFSKAMKTLEEAEITARIYSGNYEFDAAKWDPKAAEGQLKNDRLNLKKVGEVEPYRSNLN
ncbi:MAG: hypothetical protein ABEJ98_00580 [Candidatus Nanohaloarchaea archaeon]